MSEALPSLGPLEARVYEAVAASDGVKAREIARQLGVEHAEVNRLLYGAPLLRELCYRDDDSRWHGLIRQERPHAGLREFSGWYSTVEEFLSTEEEVWLARLKEGCFDIGRSLNDRRGLFHSFRDCGAVMRRLFRELEEFGVPGVRGWELVFELRIRKSRAVRIYADVLVVTERQVFSLEFKMKDAAEPQEVFQAAKYAAYLEVIFGRRYDILPALVLTGAAERFGYEQVPGADAVVPVCSGEMLFNVFNEYLGFLEG